MKLGWLADVSTELSNQTPDLGLNGNCLGYLLYLLRAFLVLSYVMYVLEYNVYIVML